MTQSLNKQFELLITTPAATREWERLYWRCQIGGWLCTSAAIMLMTTAAGDNDPLFTRFQKDFLFATMGVVYTHLYRLIIHRLRLREFSLTQIVAPVLAASLLIGIAFGSTVIALSHLFGFADGTEAPLRSVISSWGYYGAMHALLWSATYFMVHYFRQFRSEQMQRLKLSVAAKDAQLMSLIAHLNPHFVFNCLNSIRAQVSEDPSGAQTMITELATLLRYTLRSGERTTVPLEQELAAVDTYLRLERVRLEERLCVAVNISQEALHSELPPMLLQSLVESGVKHGIATRKDGGTISLTADRRESEVRIEVVNPGQSDDGNAHLGNARERLRLLFGESARITHRNINSEEVATEIFVPALD